MQITDTKEDEQKIIEWVNQIKDESTRERALGELSKKREKNIDTILECELCKKTFFNEEGKVRINSEEKYLEHLKTKEHLNAIRELQEEIFE